MDLPQQPEEPEQRLGWEERPARRLIQLALPITLSGLSFAVMGLIDTVFVAKLGPAVLAGVGLGVVITNGVMGFGFGVLRGLKTLLAQARGTGAHDASGRYVGAGVLLGLWLGLLAGVLGEVCAWLVPYVAESQAAAQAAREYIAVRSLGAPIIVVYVALREARYGLGDTRSALISSLVGNTVHVAFDYVALFVFGLGAAGAALGSVFAFSVQMALLGFAQRADGLSFKGATLKAQVAVLRAGAFTGLHWALEIGVLALVGLLLASVGDRPMAAHQLAVQLVVFSFLPALAISEAASILAAEAVGRGKLKLVHGVARTARNVALAYATLCAAVLVLGHEPIVTRMTDDAALRTLSRPVFWAAATYLVFESITVAGHGVLRGVGAQRFSALCALGSAWLCTPLLGLLFTRVLSWGAPSGFMARACEMALTSTLVWRHLEREGWREQATRSRSSLLSQWHAKA